MRQWAPHAPSLLCEGAGCLLLPTLSHGSAACCRNPHWLSTLTAKQTRIMHKDTYTELQLGTNLTKLVTLQKKHLLVDVK